MADLRQAGAHHLRLATQRVGVLDLAAIDVRMADFAVFGQQVAVYRGHVDLAGLAARFVDAGVEGNARAEHGLDAEAAAYQAGRQQVFGFEQAAQRVGGRHLGAVQQRQAFLGRQRQGSRPARASAAFAGSHSPSQRARLSPSNNSDMCASGARSPDAPTDPLSGMCG